MTQELATKDTNIGAALMEQVVIEGDLSKLSSAERVSYYQTVCKSLGLNPLTKPFEYLRLSGKLILYARRECTEQLRHIHNISTAITGRESFDGVYVVTARATMPDGRTDESTGAVPIENLKGESLANAYMKAETKAKRRVTMSICGLGFLDESEVDSIPEARVIPVDHSTGEMPEGRHDDDFTVTTPIAKERPQRQSRRQEPHQEEEPEKTDEERQRIYQGILDEAGTHGLDQERFCKEVLSAPSLEAFEKMKGTPAIAEKRLATWKEQHGLS